MEYLQITVIGVLLIIAVWTLYGGLTYLIGEAPAIVLLDIVNLIMGGSLPNGEYVKSDYKLRHKNIYKGVVLLIVSILCLFIFYKIMVYVLI